MNVPRACSELPTSAGSLLTLPDAGDFMVEMEEWADGGTLWTNRLRHRWKL